MSRRRIFLLLLLGILTGTVIFHIGGSRPHRP